jgi:hypothetical protein
MLRDYRNLSAARHAAVRSDAVYTDGKAEIPATQKVKKRESVRKCEGECRESEVSRVRARRSLYEERKKKSWR